MAGSRMNKPSTATEMQTEKTRRLEDLALPTDRLWDVHQAAAFLKRSISCVYKAAERGELPRARGFGWGRRFALGELYAYVKGIEIPVLPISRNDGGT